MYNAALPEALTGALPSMLACPETINSHDPALRYETRAQREVWFHEEAVCKMADKFMAHPSRLAF
jgi:hypothetical protein